MSSAPTAMPVTFNGSYIRPLTCWCFAVPVLDCEIATRVFCNLSHEQYWVRCAWITPWFELLTTVPLGMGQLCMEVWKRRRTKLPMSMINVRATGCAKPDVIEICYALLLHCAKLHNPTCVTLWLCTELRAMLARKRLLLCVDT